MIKQFWDNNHMNAKPESWGVGKWIAKTWESYDTLIPTLSLANNLPLWWIWTIGNTYTNNWEVPSKMVSVEDSSLRGGGNKLKQNIWNAARDTIEEWTGQELTQCSLYGVRVYYEGSILAPHVDRLPLVSSAIINVAQDLDEPWYVRGAAIHSINPTVSILPHIVLFSIGLWRSLVTMEEQKTWQWSRVGWSNLFLCGSS
jgi:hypothetical protein